MNARPPVPIWLLLTFGLLLVVTGTLGLWSRARRPSVSAPAAPPAQIFRPAPDFTLRTFDGKPLALSNFRGKVVVLNFWASWCTPCKQEMPNLERAWKEFKDRGVVVLGIDVLDDIEDAAAFLKLLKITYPNVFDPDNARMNTYQVTALPTTIFIDRQMRIRGRFIGGYIGERGYQELREQIMTLLEHR